VGIFLAILAGLLLGGTLVYFWQKPYADSLRQDLRTLRQNAEERSRLLEIELQDRTKDKQIDFQRHLNSKVDELTERHREEMRTMESQLQSRLSQQAEDIAQQYQIKIRDLEEAHRLELQRARLGTTNRSSASLTSSSSLATETNNRDTRSSSSDTTHDNSIPGNDSIPDNSEPTVPPVPIVLSAAGLPLQGSFSANQPDIEEDSIEASSEAAAGVMSEGVMSEGVMSEGVMSEGVMSEGVMSEGVMSEGVMSEGVISATSNRQSTTLPTETPPPLDLPLTGSFGFASPSTVESSGTTQPVNTFGHTIGQPTPPTPLSEAQAREIQTIVTEADAAQMVATQANAAQLSQPTECQPTEPSRQSASMKRSDSIVGNAAQIITHLNNADSPTRQQIAQQLGQLATSSQPRTERQRIINSLIQLSQDSSASVRQTAIQALGTMRSPKVIPTLKRALRDVNPAVVKAASEAIAPFKSQILPKKTIKVKRKLTP
jgi:hypothetical protein